MSFLGRLLTPKKHFCKFTNYPAIVNCVRHCDHRRETHRKSIYKNEERKKIKLYFLQRYINYIKNYETILEKKFPAAIGTYRVFKDGCKTFMKDTKEYFRIVMFLNKPENHLSLLLRRELELYEQLPKDMYRVAPVLIIFSIPLGPYIILPLAYAFPRHFLCSHFWSPDQKVTFHLLNMRDRLVHNRPVFRHLQSQMGFLKKHSLYRNWSEVIGMLASGTQPNVKQILACKELFATEPYNLMYLSTNHVRHLCKMHALHIGFFKRVRLAERAHILVEMDRAIMREGGVHNLSFDVLKNCCFIRGLNPENVTEEEMVNWLNQWIQLSSQVQPVCYSLLLHAPLLLAYNSPSNWKLIYEKKSVIKKQ